MIKMDMPKILIAVFIESLAMYSIDNAVFACFNNNQCLNSLVQVLDQLKSFKRCLIIELKLVLLMLKPQRGVKLYDKNSNKQKPLKIQI